MPRLLLGSLGLAACCVAGKVCAHGGVLPDPGLFSGSDIWALIPLSIATGLYLIGLRRLWPRSTGRGTFKRDVAVAMIGWATLWAALVPPLDRLSGVLFSAHMVQHLLLMNLAAPLVGRGQALAPFLWSLPLAWRRSLGRWAVRALARGLSALLYPLPATLIHGAALWVWHAPGLFAAALENDAIHALQHLSFFGSALLFWWSLFHHRTGRAGTAVLCLFLTSVHSGVLSALLTFAPAPWYPEYFASAPTYGLSALEDQQLGGLIMWVPANLVYLIAGLALFAGWLRESERHAAKRWAGLHRPRAAEELP